MALIKLTHVVHGQRKPVYLSTEQIVRIADALAADKSYQTTILLTNSSQDVVETVAEVVQSILHPNAPGTADA
jgi:hypothetical protein